MTYFDQDFQNFFSELEKNNNKDWFDKNRKRYEKSVKIPFTKFIDELIGLINEDDPEVRIQAKEAIFRINRDVRFSKDKSPYKTHMSAIISHGGRKDKSVPGIYVQLDHKEIRFYGGAHMVDKDQLYKIRKAIANDLQKFQKLIDDPVFKMKFGKIHGEQNKRIPEEFQTAYKVQPLIANKNYYYYAILDRKYITKNKLPGVIMDYYFVAKSLKNFFANALNNKL